MVWVIQRENMTAWEDDGAGISVQLKTCASGIWTFLVPLAPSRKPALICKLPMTLFFHQIVLALFIQTLTIFQYLLLNLLTNSTFTLLVLTFPQPSQSGGENDPS